MTVRPIASPLPEAIRAFGKTTELPLTLRAVEDFHLAHHGKRHESPFCALMAQWNGTLRGLPRRAAEDFGPLGPGDSDRHVFCGIVGVCCTSAGGREPARFLQTGEVMVANQLVIQRDHAEPPSITRARQFILNHRGEELSLATVAKAVNMSSYYFCKTFKKVTGLNFTDYLARVRIEKAKELLLDPNARVSEVVFEVGFQSFTHFNRIFKRHVGKSPTEYRESLPKAAQLRAGFAPAQGK